MNTPNKLTIGRIIATPFFMAALMIEFPFDVFQFFLTLFWERGTQVLTHHLRAVEPPHEEADEVREDVKNGEWPDTDGPEPSFEDFVFKHIVESCLLPAGQSFQARCPYISYHETYMVSFRRWNKGDRLNQFVFHCQVSVHNRRILPSGGWLPR